MAIGGYDYKLVNESLIGEYTCPICTLVLRDPQLTRCGHLVCESCLQQLKDKWKNFTCPTCRANLANNFFPDERANRAIKTLQVYCNNKDDHCQWKGDLKNAEDHLQECPYQLVSCSNDCGMDLQRRHLQNHLENDCPNRLHKCQYCNAELSIEMITGDHLGECPEYPIRCTNDGCDQLIPRQLLSSHKELCPKEIISCGYASVGCKMSMKRDEQEEHNDEFVKQHLQLAVERIEITENMVKAITRSNQKLQISNVIKFSDFTDKKRGDICWYSPGFYISPGGYKMCLNVDANGYGLSKGTHVSCFIYLMSGDYDDILEWPFHGEVTVELLNQLEDRHHHKEYFNFSESTMKESKQRVIGTSRSATGVGKHQFIPHSQLFFKPSPIPFHNSQYLKDDTLYFRVSVKATPNKPWLST